MGKSKKPHAKPHANLTQKQQRTHDLTGLPMLPIVILK
jgi:hypothetical protein